jgi:hypothetical protein
MSCGAPMVVTVMFTAALVVTSDCAGALMEMESTPGPASGNVRPLSTG